MGYLKVRKSSSSYCGVRCKTALIEHLWFNINQGYQLFISRELDLAGFEVWTETSRTSFSSVVKITRKYVSFYSMVLRVVEFCPSTLSFILWWIIGLLIFVTAVDLIYIGRGIVGYNYLKPPHWGCQRRRRMVLGWLLSEVDNFYQLWPRQFLVSNLTPWKSQVPTTLDDRITQQPPL